MADFDMELEEEEEPLFADDLEDDDDIPALPPPMPSLSQFNTSQHHQTHVTPVSFNWLAIGGVTIYLIYNVS